MITALVAVLALLLSVLTVYLQFYRKRHDVRVSLLAARGSSIAVADGCSLSATPAPCIAVVFAFSNSGDTAAVIDKISILADSSRLNIELPWTVFDDGRPVAPLSLSPGAVLRVGIHFRYYQEMFRDLPPLPGYKCPTLSTPFEFQVINSAGSATLVTWPAMVCFFDEGLVIGIRLPRAAEKATRLLP